jgi:hypothetical protein
MKENSTTLYWFAAAFFTFIGLLFLLPATYYYFMGWYIAVFIGIRVGFLVLCGILNLKSFREILFVDIKQSHFILPIFVLILCSVTSSQFLNNRFDIYLKKYGVKAEALIQNGNQVTSQVTTGKFNRKQWYSLCSTTRWLWTRKLYFYNQ